MEDTRLKLDLPGFRFHPTEEELLEFYLKNMVSGNNTCAKIIGFLNIYLYDPWILPELSKIGEREWYFFVPRSIKNGNGGRPNRTTKNGFWKATGSDRKIYSSSKTNKYLGLKKTLVFYKGRAPNGSKTDWVMSEYRLPESSPLSKEMVLCKVYRKATSIKVLEQRAAMEEAQIPSSPSSIHCQRLDSLVPLPIQSINVESNLKSERQQGTKPEITNRSRKAIRTPIAKKGHGLESRFTVS